MIDFREGGFFAPSFVSSPIKVDPEWGLGLKIYFPLFSLTITNGGGICILKSFSFLRYIFLKTC